MAIEQTESLMYQEKLIHKLWMERVIMQGVRPSAEASRLVEELLVTYVEAGPDISSSEDDIFETASELAELVLAEMPMEQAIAIYRDHLLGAMLDFSGEQVSIADCRNLVRLSGILSTAFCQARSDLLRKDIRHERMKAFASELKMAKSIQSHLLPKTIPQIPGFEFAGKLIPASEVGGDYWSVKYYEFDGIVTMKLADISGHGVAAATLVSAVKFISGCYYYRSSSAAEVMNHTNRVLTKETPHDILVTMVYGWLRPAEHRLTVVNAGHEPAFVCRDGVCTDLAPTGPVLGLIEGVQYGETTVDLCKGDIVFFGSDGITDAGVGRRFGKDRLKALVSENAHLNAEGIITAVTEAVRAYAPEQHDDISLLVTKVTSDPPRPSHQEAG